MARKGGALKGAQQGASSSYKQEVSQIIQNHLDAYFGGTLANLPDIRRLFMSLIQRESSFNPNARGITYGQSHINKVHAYSKVFAAYHKGTSLERSNIENSISAMGLTQCTGYYLLRGAGPTGMSEIERLRPDLAGQLCIPIGQDVSSVLTGESNTSKQILAGLIILEDKYKNYSNSAKARERFSDRVTATFAAYLGLGSSDGLNTTPQGYADSIIRGASYTAANGGVGLDGRYVGASNANANANANTNTSGSPVKTTASGKNLSTPGC